MHYILLIAGYENSMITGTYAFVNHQLLHIDVYTGCIGKDRKKLVGK